MLSMQARPAVRVRQGPLLFPARYLLLVSGLVALALGSFNLYHELHAAQVDTVYTAAALFVFVVWLASIILGFRGQPIGVFLTGAIAFIQLGEIAQQHFAATAGAIGSFVRIEGLPVAADLIGLVIACVLTVVAAIVCWGHATGYNRHRATLPLLIVATIGTVLAVLEATDNVHLAGSALPGFGTTTAEDGAFAAAITAALWLIGGLWIARVRRVGALLIALATFGICYSFVVLHVRGGTPLSLIATKSGLIWAVIAAAVAILAAASLLVALGLLAMSVIRRKPATLPGGTQPARREA
jgi:hypothetical protein